MSTNMLNAPIEYLRLYDNFDLNERCQRRLAAYALVDFYGDILSQAGIKHLEFPDQVGKTIGSKWNTAKTRLQALDIDIPEKYSSIIHRLGDLRNDIAHDHTLNPERQILEEARVLAEEWVDWFEQAIEKYETEKGERSAKETMSRIATATLDSVQESPSTFREDDLASEQKTVNEEAEQLRQTIDGAMATTEGITKQLIFALADAKELEQQKRDIDIRRSRQPKTERQRKLEQRDQLRELRDTLKEIQGVLSKEKSSNE